MANLADIQKKIKELQEQEAEIIKKEKEQVISRILSDMTTYGITAEDLGIGSAKTQKKNKEDKKDKVVKYRKGDLTWSGGRGKKPQWVQEVISKESLAGLEKYRVEE